MKILLVNHFPLEGSGSGTYTKNIAEYQVKRGHEVHIVFPENAMPTELPGIVLHPVFFREKDDSTNALPDALPFNFPCFTTHPRSNTTFADLNELQWEQYVAAFDRAITEEVSKFQPDIIHGQHLWCLSALAAKHNCRCIVTAHGTDLMGCEKWPQLRKYAEDAVSHCDRIISISKDNFNIASQMFPGSINKMILLHNGYNESIFYPEDLDPAEVLNTYGIPYNNEQIIFFAGKLTGFKGVDVLLHAAKKYERLSLQPILTLLAGSGEKYDELNALTEKLQLKSVHFLGHLDQPSVRRLYNIADVFTMPSRREPFGLVAIEAMACGTPVVASNEGGLPEFVREEVGSLVPVDDADALCNALLKELRCVRENSHRREEVASYAAQHYTQSKFMDKLEEIYAQIFFKQ